MRRRRNMRRINVGRLMSEVAVDGDARGTRNGTPGAQLALARSAMGWTVEQVAEQLKLAPRQVQALEACDYKALPGLATVRGFVRAYAKLVKLDAAPLVAMIGDQDVPVSTLPPVRRDLAMPFSEVRLPSMRRRGVAAVNWWILGAILLVVVVGVAAKMGWLKPLPADLLKRAPASVTASASASVAAPVSADNAESSERATASTPTPSTLTPSAPVVSGTFSASASAPESSVGTSVASISVASNPVASNSGASGVAVGVTTAVAPGGMSAPNITPAPGNVGNSLILKFRQDCWVEVKKVNGNVLLSRLIKAGETETISMADPVQLVLGNNTGVEASLRGMPLNLKNGPGNTTRLTIK